VGSRCQRLKKKRKENEEGGNGPLRGGAVGLLGRRAEKVRRLVFFLFYQTLFKTSF
jgi:hypothetical protein